MSAQKYRELINVLYELVMGKDFEIPPNYEAFDITLNDDIPFILTHGGEADEEALYVVARYGSLPEDRKVIALIRLMESNLFLYGDNRPCFCFDQELDEVVMMMRLLLPTMTPPNVVKLLQHMAMQISLWRECYFLEEHEVDPDKLSSSAFDKEQTHAAISTTLIPNMTVRLLSNDRGALSITARDTLKYTYLAGNDPTSMASMPPLLEKALDGLEKKGLFIRAEPEELPPFQVSGSIKLLGGEEGETARVIATKVEGLYQISCEYRQKTVIATGDNYFKAFCKIRRHMEKDFLLPFCYGASINVFYEDGIDNDIAPGMTVCKLQPGRKTNNEDRVPLFADGPDVLPALVGEQREFHDLWLHS